MALSIRQTRVFVPSEPPFEDEAWVEGLLGRVVAPLVQGEPSLEWFWFSRYVQRPDGDLGDCDILQIPEAFVFDGNTSRSLRFRYAVSDSNREVFEHHARTLIDASGCKISDFREYDWTGDLGGSRFLSEDRRATRCRKRADLVAKYLSALCQLMLDSLQGPDQDGRCPAPRSGVDR